MSFTCKLIFENSVSGTNTFDFMATGTTPRGDFKWSRNINKNAIYVTLPVGEGVSAGANPLTEGGYGYDLGFLQDNFVLELKTTNYTEYERLVNLIKTNTGEKPASLKIGYGSTPTEYNVMPRYCNFTGAAGGDLITVSVTLTVVSKVYNS